MRIVKVNKTVNAAKEDFEYEVQGNYGYGWDCLTTEATMAEAKEQKKCYDENEPNVPHRIKTVSKIGACGDVNASKKLSANDQALQHIKAAIDILGKSGMKDDVTKDSIANLGIVAMDIKSSIES